MKPNTADVLNLAAAAMSLLGGVPPLGWAGAVVAVAAIVGWLVARYDCVDLFGVRLRRRQDTRQVRQKGGVGRQGAKGAKEDHAPLRGNRR